MCASSVYAVMRSTKRTFYIVYSKCFLKLKDNKYKGNKEKKVLLKSSKRKRKKNEEKFISAMVGCGEPVTEWEKRIKFHVGNGSFLFPLKRLFTCNTTVLYSYCCNGTFASLYFFLIFLFFFVILCNTQ